MAQSEPESPPTPRPGRLAVRPPPRPAASAPGLAGTAIAAVDGDFEAGRFFLALIGAIFIQIVVNFANDLSDFRRGADTPDRLGPPRAVAQGWLSQREMTVGISLATAAAMIVGVVLTLIVGWPILIIGAAALIAAVTYTGGPMPYGYRGLGDAICFLFFGFVAVIGAGYVQIEELTWELAAASVPVGCLVTAILVVNNLRDIGTDRASGKRTLAVLIGERNTRIEYATLVLGAFVSIAIFTPVGLLPHYCFIAFAALAPGMRLTREILNGRSGAALNPMLKRTAQLHLLVGALIGLGGVLATL
ncbi:MAG: 1,4-dihydroxy-2-naphthoate polyprenyltransferase [Chloroflexi bacterium]|nr:1,4-dihydroxy-2-naphthoate polyprenyltransferase [Chloroflexota bacterium]